MFKREDKYLVLKLDDLSKYLDPEDREKLDALVMTIGWGRGADGKKDNTYVVVNEDEPYAEIVWKLIEMEETWKEKYKGKHE